MNIKKIRIFCYYVFLIFVAVSVATYKNGAFSFVTASEFPGNFFIGIASLVGSFFLSVFGFGIYPIIILLFFKNFFSFKNLTLLFIVVFLFFQIILLIPISENWLFSSYGGLIGFLIKSYTSNIQKSLIIGSSSAFALLIILNVCGILTVRNIKKFYRTVCKSIKNRFAKQEIKEESNAAKEEQDYEKNFIIFNNEQDQCQNSSDELENLNEVQRKETVIKTKYEENTLYDPEQKKAHSPVTFFKKLITNQKRVENTVNTIPPLNFLNSKKEVVKQHDQNLHKGQMLEKVLSDFRIEGKITEISVGPVVTLYELQPAAGVKSSTVISLATDVARTMSAISARISIIPGRNALGIELPNAKREIVLLRELLEAKEYQDKEIILPIALGKSINGTPIIVDLVKMPHLLVAGTTGSGKSVAINAMILSILYRLSPSECKLILIDPKMLELSVYDDIPHLLSPVVIDPKKAVVALKWVVKEMEKRYKLMSKLSVRNIDGYNRKAQQFAESGQKFEYQDLCGFDPVTGERLTETRSVELTKMPFIIVIVDEMADLMLVAGKEIETSIQRLAQMARASGIHIIMATQRPSVDVITGVIKANFPTRISFAVTSKIDSRTILGEQGAEQLLGRGDMLYMASGRSAVRIHGPFVGDSEVENIVNYLKQFGVPEYNLDITTDEEESDEIDDIGSASGEDFDSMYSQAVNIIKRDNKVSISYIQRKLSIGYNKAAKIVEKMEANGVVSAPNHSGKRMILNN